MSRLRTALLSLLLCGAPVTAQDLPALPPSTPVLPDSSPPAGPAPTLPPVPPAPEPVLRCGSGASVPSTVSAVPLPSGVTGRVSFYAAEYDPVTLKAVRAVTLGDPDAVHPLASSFKPLVVQGVLQDVDAGRFTLGTPFTTTAENRSIESYPPGTNTLLKLARRAIILSDNTASDILHLAYGPERLARIVRARSACTTVLLTTKAWWGAQAGLAPQVLTGDTAAGARGYAGQPFEARLGTAAALIAASRAVTGPDVERALDVSFHGPAYTPDLEVHLQNTSTARAYTDLMVGTMSGRMLAPATRSAFRDMLSSGCCRPATPNLASRFWGAKAGSGWRVVTLTGEVETRDGRVFGYTYLNDGSDTRDSLEMERQIRPVVQWIERNLLNLQRGP